MDKVAKRIVTPRPMVSCHSARNINCYLASGKLYPVKQMVSSYKQNRKWY